MFISVLRRLEPFPSLLNLSLSLASLVASIHTCNRSFPFRWFFSRFLLDCLSLSFTTSCLWDGYLCLLGVVHFLFDVQAISTFFAWWQCWSFPFRFYVSSPFLPCVTSISLVYSPQGFVHQGLHNDLIMFIFQVSLP